MEKEKKHNIDKFQGYPHYPANEDITRAKNNNGKVTIEKTGAPQSPFNDTVDDRDDEVNIVPGTDADVTDEDLRALDAAEQNMDTMDSSNLVHSSLDNADEDGDLLNENSSLVDDMSGSGLDVPENERVDEDDEENDFYSLGGDLHESQEENKGD